MSRTKEVFSLFSGIWKFTRHIVDKTHKHESYEGTGYAVFSLLEESNKLKYYERVKLKNLTTKSEMQLYQTYQYLYTPEQDEIKKYFHDGRLFYTLKILGLECRGEHLCLKDNYKAFYNINNNNNFSLEYQVQGPEKDYTMTTEYTRIEEQSTSLLGIDIVNGEIGELP